MTRLYNTTPMNNEWVWSMVYLSIRMMETNYIGAFALTHLLLPLLGQSSAPSRVVFVTSFTHRCGKMNFEATWVSSVKISCTSWTHSGEIKPIIKWHSDWLLPVWSIIFIFCSVTFKGWRGDFIEVEAKIFIWVQQLPVCSSLRVF